MRMGTVILHKEPRARRDSCQARVERSTVRVVEEQWVRMTAESSTALSVSERASARRSASLLEARVLRLLF